MLFNDFPFLLGFLPLPSCSIALPIHIRDGGSDVGAVVVDLLQLLESAVILLLRIDPGQLAGDAAPMR